MINRVLILISVLCVFALAKDKQPNNWNGYQDSTNIIQFAADSLKYSDVFNFTDWADEIVSIVKCDDTTTAGRGADSIQFFYGYQTGYFAHDSAGAYDTAWTDYVIIDTVDVDSFGVARYNSMTKNGVVTMAGGSVDTSSITGYASQVRAFTPLWGMYIRFFFKGMAGNNDNAYHDLKLDVRRRKYDPVRSE